MPIPVTILPGTLPEGYCWPPDPQTYNVDIVTRMVAFIANALTGLYASPTTPPVDQRDKVWFNTNNQRLYWFISGAWQRTYDVPAGSGELRAIEVSVADYNTSLGADATGVGSGSVGQLWEEATEYAGRALVGTGVIPGSSPPVTLALGDTGGEYKHVLTVAEMQHMHGVGTDGNIMPDGSIPGSDDDPPVMLYRPWSSAQTYTERYCDQSPSASGGWKSGPTLTGGTMGTSKAFDDTNETVAGHLTMPPFKAVNWVRRSGRIYVPAPY